MTGRALPSPPAYTSSIIALLALACVMGIPLSAEESTQTLIRRVIAQTTRSGLAIRAVRHLQAGTRSGRHQATMQVETSVTPRGDFSWRVIEEGGSERTRDKVLRAVLEAEAETWKAGALDRAALTPANYQFLPEADTGRGEVRIRLKPLREESALLDGVLTVSHDGYPVLLEGRMAKSPSFWVKSVTVVKRFGRFAGVALPVEIESLADVKMFGQSSFSMRYRYTEVNGRSVGHTAEFAPVVGPSPAMLAVYARTSGR